MAVGNAHVFPGFLTPVLTQLSKNTLERKVNSKPPGHESDTLTTEPSGRGPDLSKGRHNNI